MSTRLPLPDTLFGRLFVATVGVIGIMLMIIVLLIVRERRELALLDSGSGTSATLIAETSQYLAGLSGHERDEARDKLREQRLLPSDVPRRSLRPRPQDEDSISLQRAFATHLQKQLGNGYSVAAGPPRTRRAEVIPMYPDPRASPATAVPGRADGGLPRGDGVNQAHRPEVHFVSPPGHPADGRVDPSIARLHRIRLAERIFDITVTLPDGDRAVFRLVAPHPGPRLPRLIFVELGILAAALSVVLYAMTRTITRPLGDLARAADAVGRGASTAPLEERGARELRRATRAFNAMQERLRRYLDSRTRVLAAMSHDLRTPLTRLRLRVESIDDEQLRQRCAEDLDEMSDMIRGALGVFRGLNDEEQPVPLDIDALALELQRQHAEVGGEVEIVGHAQSNYVARPLALKRCLGNLVGNAIRHGKHAAIHIEDGKQLVIRILDEGPGIPEDSLEKVFEPFFRLESSRSRDTGGTGLGLSIARDVAQSHGGSLTLRNRKEGGLEATLVLPR